MNLKAFLQRRVMLYQGSQWESSLGTPWVSTWETKHQEVLSLWKIVLGHNTALRRVCRACRSKKIKSVYDMING